MTSRVEHSIRAPESSPFVEHAFRPFEASISSPDFSRCVHCGAAVGFIRRLGGCRHLVVQGTAGGDPTERRTRIRRLLGARVTVNES